LTADSRPDAAAPQPGAPTRSQGHGFGTMPVFLAAISTILGAIMFLRFGYAVANLGLIGALGIVVLGHLVTIPTAMAISEIATNRKVEGGGEYFIISRSFGIRIGAAIGLSLYLSQAVSVSFYCIAFAEAFRPLVPGLESLTGLAFDPRMVSLPVTVGLVALMLTKGADLGVKALYVVVAVLTASIVLFLLGGPTGEADGIISWTATVPSPDGFAVVFAICFPAFTGMTAGVGLSGDLKKPSRSIPLGTMIGTITGLVVYTAIVVKLATSATPELLAEDQLVMSRIAVWSPIIPIGLGCATLSSAIGSILIAPRTLQALGKDGAFMPSALNGLLSRGKGEANEPRNATVLTGAIAVTFVALGDVDAVARMISMFFMVTYGALCTASFLEHFAASPSYRPSFRSRWYLSLLGSGICLLMMFQMDPIFAVLALLAMAVFYAMTRFTPAGAGGNDVAALVRAAMTQLTRRLQVRLQRGHASAGPWRPGIVMIGTRTFAGSPWPLRLVGWLGGRVGFGTYLHYVRGLLDETSDRQRRELRTRLIEMQSTDLAGVYVDCMVSPSLRTAVAQTLQVPGVSGMENNTLLFELKADDDNALATEVLDCMGFAAAVRKNVLLLRHSNRSFGKRRQIHIWLTWDDDTNATLMVMLAYVLLGHRDWKRATVHVFAALPADRVTEERQRLLDLIAEGRLPISPANIRFFPVDSVEAFRGLVENLSAEADLVFKGATRQGVEEAGTGLLRRYPAVGDVLFVLGAEKVVIE